MTFAAIGTALGMSAGTAAVVGAGTTAVGAIGSKLFDKSSSATTVTGPTNGTEKGTITTSGFDPEIIKQLKEILASGAFSKDTANADSESAALGAMRDVMQQFMPDIAGATKKAGMSNGSMTAALANQTANNAAYAGSKLKLDTINSYNANFAQLLNTLASGQAKTETRDLVTTATPTQSQQSSGMCWITTVVCKFYNHADDCSILTTLRKFRDTYMKDPDFPERSAMISEYYASAKVYEPMLECLSDGAKILHFSKYMKQYILPAVQAIDDGNDSEALILYTNMFNDVKALHDKVTQH